MLRILIVDDEPLARQRVRRMLGDLPDVEVCGEAGSADEARAALAAAPTDVLLLDIQMPGEDGFALLRGLSPRPAVVLASTG